MSKQQQAPGELELVREFVNTADLEDGTDELTSGQALVAWLAEHGLAPSGGVATRSQLARAIEVREAMRAILLAHNERGPAPASAYEALDQAAQRARVRLRFADDGGARLVPDAEGADGGLGRLVAIVHAAIANGTWERLKACRWHTCEWAFYDHTKNRSGAWCTMDVCGNRAKARTYRTRRR
jgi:predicted RNA-binding Zn ribbon-like protein